MLHYKICKKKKKKKCPPFSQHYYTLPSIKVKPKKCIIASSWRGVEMYICFMDGHMYS